MNRLLLTLLAALLAVFVLAAQLGGALGGGVLAGGVVGAGFTALACSYLRHVLATRPERSLQAAVVGFLVKLAVLLLGALAFRFIEPAGAWVDWRAFVITYAAVVALLLPFLTWIAVREQRQRATGRAARA